jgi:hypothetical protein
MKYLLTIEESFDLESIGRVVVATFDKDEPFPECWNGDHIVIEKENGEKIETFIKSIRMIRYMKIPDRLPFSFQLPDEILIDDIPKGSKVYRK